MVEKGSKVLVECLLFPPPPDEFTENVLSINWFKDLKFSTTMVQWFTTKQRQKPENYFEKSLTVIKLVWITSQG